jgi:hypothetical protein
MYDLGEEPRRKFPEKTSAEQRDTEIQRVILNILLAVIFTFGQLVKASHRLILRTSLKISLYFF